MDECLAFGFGFKAAEEGGAVFVGHGFEFGVHFAAGFALDAAVGAVVAGDAEQVDGGARLFEGGNGGFDVGDVGGTVGQPRGEDDFFAVKGGRVGFDDGADFVGAAAGLGVAFGAVVVPVAVGDAVAEVEVVRLCGLVGHGGADVDGGFAHDVFAVAGEVGVADLHADLFALFGGGDLVGGTFGAGNGAAVGIPLVGKFFFRYAVAVVYFGVQGVAANGVAFDDGVGGFVGVTAD